MIKKFNKKIKNKKLGKFLFIGGFTFFLIKGLIWLIIFFTAGISLINFSN
tara:strand:+ start:498 stop:647 length:150 start_codon:yes stop_codon:yes gene_type:complete